MARWGKSRRSAVSIVAERYNYKIDEAEKELRVVGWTPEERVKRSGAGWKTNLHGQTLAALPRAVGEAWELGGSRDRIAQEESDSRRHVLRWFV
jgi:hypothetical protein